MGNPRFQVIFRKAIYTVSKYPPFHIFGILTENSTDVVCPESLNAIQGALGTVCEAVDRVVDSSRNPSKLNSPTAFVAVRPPGHHCGENTPCGFCFVNNVVVAAAHGKWYVDSPSIELIEICSTPRTRD